jgi:hypothetical protein
MSGSGIDVERAWTEEHLLKQRLREINRLSDETFELLPALVEDMGRLREGGAQLAVGWFPGFDDEMKCIRTNEVKCFIENSCIPENWETLVDLVDRVGIKEYDLKTLLHPAKVEPLKVVGNQEMKR